MANQTPETQPNNEAAAAAFMQRKAAIDTMLARLIAHSDDHFGIHPDEINYGHVGNLGHVEEKLREACDFIFGEGDCAD